MRDAPSLSAGAQRVLGETHARQATSLRAAWRCIWLLLTVDVVMVELLAGTIPKIVGNESLGAAVFMTVATRVTIGRTRGQNNALTFALAAFTLLAWNLVTAIVTVFGVVHAARTGSLFPLAIVGTTFAVELAMVRRASWRRRFATDQPPLRLLVLWVFGSHGGLVSLMRSLGAQWSAIGNATALEGPAVTRTSTGKIRRSHRVGTSELTVTGSSDVDRIVDRWKKPSARPWLVFPCADDVWQLAVGKLIDESDVVLMDLGRFSRASRGCAWEVKQLVDHMPNDRVVLVVDETTDRPLLDETLNAAWESLAPSSPNAVPEPHAIRIVDLGDLRRGTDLGGAPFDAIMSRIESEADRLMAVLCEVVASARAEGPAHAARRCAIAQRPSASMPSGKFSRL